MLSPAEIKTLLTESPSDSYGRHCNFYLVGNVGLKTYDSEKMARWSYNHQKIAAEHKLGPRVIGDLITDFNNKVYAFFTELCEPFEECDDYEATEEKVQDLSDALGAVPEISYTCQDLIEANMGEHPEFGTVCLDFGPPFPDYLNNY